jgi:hypothetical protein
MDQLLIIRTPFFLSKGVIYGIRISLPKVDLKASGSTIGPTAITCSCHCKAA